MRSSRVIVLGILLVVLAGVVWTKFMPQVQEFRRQLTRKKNYEEKSAEMAVRTAPVELSRAPRLKDGSYNPIPPVKRTCTEGLTSLTQTMNWREKYEPLLKKTRPADSNPGFYVYSFLDLTPEGVGPHCTYGWRLVGSAALAQWTDARLAGAREPRQFGVPPLDERAPQSRPTAKAWLKEALEDPATKDARYVITGFYQYDAQARQYALEVKLLDRQKPESVSDLATTHSAKRGDFPELSATQRAMARQMAEKLIGMGVVHPRPAVEAAGLKLEQEIGEVSRMLDSADSWVMMDGIDRALALAELFPKETLPLQAASYGLLALDWAYLGYAEWNLHTYETCMRAYALSQAALAMDARPTMSRLNWVWSCTGLGQGSARLLGPLDDASNRQLPPELAHYRNIIIQDQGPGMTLEERTLLPDWQFLWQEKQMSWFITDSGDRGLYEPCLKHWRTNDLYLEALLHGYVARYNIGDMNRLNSLSSAAAYSAAGDLAAEIAATLTAMGPGEEADKIISKLIQFDRTQAGANDGVAGALASMLKQRPKLDLDEINKQTEARNYHQLRQALAAPMVYWGPPLTPDHPAYQTLTLLEPYVAKLTQEAQLCGGATRFAGFEFSPARRIMFTSWRDYRGPFMLAKQASDRYGAFEEAARITQLTLKARTQCAAAYSAFAGLFGNSSRNADAKNLKDPCNERLRAMYPLASQTLFNLGQIRFDGGDRKLGLAYLDAYMRSDPFNVGRNQLLGDFYVEHGYHAKAVEYLTEYLKDAPQRYDYANKRAWSLCQLGRSGDKEVRETFARPAPRLPGNLGFHMENLRYLVNWAQDYPAAREACLFYIRCAGQRVDPQVWMAAIERSAGDTTKGLTILQNIRFGDYDNIQWAATEYAEVAEAFMDFDRPDLAERCIDQGVSAGADTGQESLMTAIARLSYAKGEYARAMEQYQADLDRYGFNTGSFLMIVSCLEKMGKRAEAVKMLEEKVAEDKDQGYYVSMYTQLMRYYSEDKESKKMKPLMKAILKSPYRRRRIIFDTLEYYKKCYPEESKEIWNRIDKIMEAPEE